MAPAAACQRAAVASRLLWGAWWCALGCHMTGGAGNCTAAMRARRMEALKSCQLDMMLLYETVSENVMTVLLPINTMRNYALLQVRLVGCAAAVRPARGEAGEGGEGPGWQPQHAQRRAPPGVLAQSQRDHQPAVAASSAAGCRQLQQRRHNWRARARMTVVPHGS